MDWECAAGIRRPPRNRYYISPSWEPSAVCSFTWSERPSARYVMFAQVARFVFIAVHITSDHCRVKDDKTNVFLYNLKRRGNRRIDFIAMIDGKVSRNEWGWVDEREVNSLTDGGGESRLLPITLKHRRWMYSHLFQKVLISSRAEFADSGERVKGRERESS